MSEKEGEIKKEGGGEEGKGNEVSNQANAYVVNDKLLDRFLNMGLQCLPFAYVSQENNRLMLLYFIIGGYDIRGKISELDQHKENFINWIYSQQLLPDPSDPEKNKKCCGFRGSPLIGNPWNPNCEATPSLLHDYSHITNTYTALAVLKILGDDFSRINKNAIITSLRYLQNDDGSFNCLATGSEYDLRFVYCACCICYLLDDWNGMDVNKTFDYIKSCQNFDGAMGQYPGQESHGGSTYCGVASLSLLNRLNDIPSKDKLIRWLVERQITGFQGRINKDPDTCYSWWVGASLKILGAFEFVDTSFLTSFHFSCQSKIGGFSKVPGVHPDLLHTYFSLCALQMSGFGGMEPLNYSLGLTLRSLAQK